MSGKLKGINHCRRSRIKMLQQNLAASREAKKAKLSQYVIPCTPETTVHLEPKFFCATCSSQKIIDSNHISITQWEDEDQVKLGRDSEQTLHISMLNPTTPFLKTDFECHKLRVKDT